MLKDKVILLTGGTGSFGQKFIEMTLAKYSPKKIIIYSRDEMKQEAMERSYPGDNRLRFFLGDIRDKDRLKRACQGVDYIVHAAALKIVPAAEYNPFECIKTNVLGAMNLIDCALDANVQKVIALSTDKACNPVNLYGASKLCSDKLFIAGNSYAGTGNTLFSVVRYGNVMGSRGSVIPFYLKLANEGATEIPVTHPEMTRFMITLEQGVELVWEALDDAIGGEVYVKKIPSMKVLDIARVIAPHLPIKIIGIRPGEKIHEQMISVEDARSTYEYSDHYKIFPQLLYLKDRWTRIETKNAPLRVGIPVSEGFCYSSDSNTSWMSDEALRSWIENTYGISLNSDQLGKHA
jgi:UDP-N-acetylglucosamine 4,6-dehydratase (inverting)